MVGFAEGGPVSSNLIEARGLVKRYGGVVATDAVSFELRPGEALGIIGPNGAGKSTLIGLLGGALSPSQGRVVFNGEDVTALAAPDRARRGIGRTFQIPRPFLDMTVRENLLVAHHALHPWGPAAEARRVCDGILARCGLADAADWACKDLPLLRRKRLEVARALALRPRLLLLDEVGAGLVDSEVTELISLINGLRKEVEGIIVIEHVLRVVRECCERLMVINFGKKFAEGPTRDVLSSDDVVSVYLGSAQPPNAAAAGEVQPMSTSPCGVLAPLVAAAGAGARDAAQPLLELRDVHAGYGQARVLNGIDLCVAPGRVVAILGTNGAGKTTLARVVSGTIRPTRGAVRVDGVDVSGRPAHEIARLGLAQCMEGRRIFGPLSVEENLLLPARGVGDDTRAQRLEQVYTLFPDLKARRRNPGTSMSGGQQQMLAIGRALMSRPSLVLFDEISLGLAPIMMDRLYLALAQLRDAGLTMLIVEQDVERALELADEVHVMEHGRFALSGRAADIRDDPRLRHLYIGSTD